MICRTYRDTAIVITCQNPGGNPNCCALTAVYVANAALLNVTFEIYVKPEHLRFYLLLKSRLFGIVF